jgi:hypothetical protein
MAMTTATDHLEHSYAPVHSDEIRTGRIMLLAQALAVTMILLILEKVWYPPGYHPPSHRSSDVSIKPSFLVMQ